MSQYGYPEFHPTIIETNITSWIRRGLGFIASHSAATQTTANMLECAFSLFNPLSSGKSVLIYSIRINAQSSGSTNTLSLTTTDPSGTTGYAATFTPMNLGIGTTSSAVSLCGSANNTTTAVTPVGTVVDTFAATGNASTELLSNGSVYLLPSGLAKGISIVEFVSTAGNAFGATVRWIEY